MNEFLNANITSPGGKKTIDSKKIPDLKKPSSHGRVIRKSAQANSQKNVDDNLA